MVCGGQVPEEPGCLFPRRSAAERGSEGQRIVTDRCCGVCFLACTVLAACLGVFCAIQGDLRRITHGHDWGGRICGVDPGVEDKPFTYLCGKQGPRPWGFPPSVDPRSTACVESCPQDQSRSIPCLLKEYSNITELGKADEQIPGIGTMGFVSTLSLDVTQTVSLQQSYPTDPFHGSFCVPKQSEHTFLRESVISGSLLHKSRVSRYVRAIKNAWLVLLISTVVAAGLGLAYLVVLNDYAGPLILVSLLLGAIILVCVGVAIFVGMFIPVGESSAYHSFSPVFRLVDDISANVYSGVLGLLITAGGLALGYRTYSTFDEIDEAIGIISAANDCIHAVGPGKNQLLRTPIVQAVFQAVAFMLSVGAFTCIASFGYFDNIDFIFGSEELPGLLMTYKAFAGWNAIMLFFVLFCLWVFEVINAINQFVISYAVCRWYFVKNQEGGGPEDGGMYSKNVASNKWMAKQTGVRVYGVDGAHGQRAGYVEQGPGGKVLVVPLAKRGPGGKDLAHQPELANIRKDVQDGDCRKGLVAAIMFHFGSICVAALMILVTRPFRWLQALCTALSGGNDDNILLGNPDDKEDKQESKSLLSTIQAGVGLFGWVLDQVFGMFNKDIYSQLVLDPCSIYHAAHDSFDFITQAGGLITFLHNATYPYELVGTLCITVVTGLIAHVMLISIPYWSDAASHGYVEDTWLVTFLSMFAAMLISHCFVAMMNVTADSLLFVFAWSRLHYLLEFRKYCPPSLAYLLQVSAQDDKLWCDACGSKRVSVQKKHNDTMFRKYCQDCPQVSIMTPADFGLPAQKRDITSPGAMVSQAGVMGTISNFSAAMGSRAGSRADDAVLPESRNARRGWLHNVNEMGAKMFAQMHDRSSYGMMSKNMLSRVSGANPAIDGQPERDPLLN